jgi:hypothetical protein
MHRYLTHLEAKEQAGANRARDVRDLEARLNNLVKNVKTWLRELDVRHGERRWDR